MGQSLQLHGGGNPAALHGIGLHEFHPGRGVEKEIPNHNGGALGASHLGFFYNVPSLQHQAGAGQTPGGFGHQFNTADGGNGCKSFAPEAHGGNGRQILGSAELGGGVAEKGRPGILGSHAAAVVGNPEEGHAPVPDFQCDLGGPGVHGIFQQLLGHGGRPLHHLTGGDEVGDMRGKLNDFGHGVTSVCRYPRH